MFDTYCDKILAHMEGNLTGPKCMQSIDNVKIQGGKNTVIRRAPYGKNGTIEFRAFVMPRTSKEHEKHIALVDAICRRAWRAVQADVVTVPIPAPLFDAKRYSSMKQGFHNMLRELGFNSADFRYESVNMARKMRWMRWMR